MKHTESEQANKVLSRLDDWGTRQGMCQLHSDSNTILYVILSGQYLCCHPLLWALELRMKVARIRKESKSESVLRALLSWLSLNPPNNTFTQHSQKLVVISCQILKTYSGAAPTVGWCCKSHEGSSDILMSAEHTVSLLIDRSETVACETSLPLSDILQMSVRHCKT